MASSATVGEQFWDRLPDAWRATLEPRIEPTIIERLVAFERRERAEGTVFPPADRVFRSLHSLDPAAVRCVILGQDPYHDDGQAHGLAFSVSAGVGIPPSLRNIFRELESDLGIAPPESGDLSAWAERGVLLLNTVLTVRAHEPLSHRKQGWEIITDAIIDAVAQQEAPTAFVLWGKPAQEKASRIPVPPHAIIASAHPSPLSARRGFLGSRPFTQVNEFLNANGRGTVDWRLAR